MIESIQSVIEQIIDVIGPNGLKYIAAAIVIVLLVSLIKKAVKFAVTVGIVAIILAYIVVPVYNNIDSKYDFSIQDGVGVITTVEGAEYKLTKEACKSIKMVEQVDSKYKLIIDMETDDIEIEIPAAIVSSILKFAENQEIPVDITTIIGE